MTTQTINSTGNGYVTTLDDRWRVYSNDPLPEGVRAWVQQRCNEQRPLVPDTTFPINPVIPPMHEFLAAEQDLIDCPVKEGDTIQVLRDRAESAIVNAGDVFAVRSVTDEGRTVIVTDQGWSFYRESVRVLPPAEIPDVPESSEFPSEALLVRARLVEGASRYSNPPCGCGHCAAIRGSVDSLITWSGGVFTTAEQKNWVGESIRAARAAVARRKAEIIASDPAAHDSTPDVTGNLAEQVASLTRQVEELTRQVAVQSREIESYRQWQQAALNDIDTLSTTMIEEANSRGWCSEYDTIVNRMNRNLNVLAMKPRRAVLDGVIRGTVTFGFEYTISEVEMDNPDDDREDFMAGYFNESVGGHGLWNRGAIDRYSGEITVYEVEVEES